MFQTDVQWEEVQYTPFLKELLQQPGLRRYPIIELQKDISPIFLEIIFEGDSIESAARTRYMCSSLATVVEVLTKNQFSEVRLHIQIFDKELQEYSIYSVAEIILTVDEENDHLLLYRRSDGQLYTDGTHSVYNHNKARTCTLWPLRKN